MRRGDIVTVAAPRDYGKPRQAVIVQSDAFPEDHASIIICPMTSTVIEAADFRLTIEPMPENGLHRRSQIMADKPVAVRRERVGTVIGRLAADEVRQLNRALALVMGLAD